MPCGEWGNAGCAGARVHGWRGARPASMAASTLLMWWLLMWLQVPRSTTAALRPHARAATSARAAQAQPNKAPAPSVRQTILAAGSLQELRDSMRDLASSDDGYVVCLRGTEKLQQLLGPARSGSVPANDRAAAEAVLTLVHSRMADALLSCRNASGVRGRLHVWSASSGQARTHRSQQRTSAWRVAGTEHVPAVPHAPALQVAALLSGLAAVSWVAEQPLTTPARHTLRTLLASQPILDSLSVTPPAPTITAAASISTTSDSDSTSSTSSTPSTSSTSSASTSQPVSAMHKLLTACRSASEAGLRVGPLPQPLLLRVVRELGRSVPLSEQDDLHACIQRVSDLEGPGGAAGEGSTGAREATEHSQEAGPRGQQPPAAGAGELRSMPVHTLPEVLACLTAVQAAAKQLSSSDRGGSSTELDTAALASVLAWVVMAADEAVRRAASEHGEQEVAGEAAGASSSTSPSTSTTSRSGRKRIKSVMTMCCPLLPQLAPGMSYSDFRCVHCDLLVLPWLRRATQLLSSACTVLPCSAVVCVLSRWCSSPNVSAGSDVMALVHVRAKQPQFLEAAEKRGEVAELLALLASHDENRWARLCLRLGQARVQSAAPG